MFNPHAPQQQLAGGNLNPQYQPANTSNHPINSGQQAQASYRSQHRVYVANINHQRPSPSPSHPQSQQGIYTSDIHHQTPSLAPSHPQTNYLMNEGRPNQNPNQSQHSVHHQRPSQSNHPMNAGQQAQAPTYVDSSHRQRPGPVAQLSRSHGLQPQPVNPVVQPRLHHQTHHPNPLHHTQQHPTPPRTALLAPHNPPSQTQPILPGHRSALGHTVNRPSSSQPQHHVSSQLPYQATNLHQPTTATVQIHQATTNSRQIPAAPSRATTASISRQTTQAPPPRTIQVSALPNLQSELKRALDANAKAAQAQAAKVAKAAARADAKAAAKQAAAAKAPPKRGTGASVSTLEANRSQSANQNTDSTTGNTSTSGANKFAPAPPPQNLSNPTPLKPAALPIADLDFSGLQSRSPSPTLPKEVPSPQAQALGGEAADLEGVNPETEDQNDSDIFDDDPGDNEHVHHPTNQTKRRKLAPELVRQLYKMELDELKTKVSKLGIYRRLVAEEKADFDEAYEEYQKHIHRIACTNLLKIEAVEAYLGQGNRARGSSLYNNFVRYNEEARQIKADKSISMGQRWSKCGLLWNSQDPETQLKYKDPAFLATLPNPFVEPDPLVEQGMSSNANIPTTTAPPLATTSSSKPQRKLAKTSKFDANRWANKIRTDGFLVVVYPHKKGRALLTGGSSMGEAFIDLFPKESNPCNDFLDFVKGQVALSKVLGSEAPLPKKVRKPRVAKNRMENSQYDKGTLEANVTAVREQLGYAIYKVTKGVRQNGWPGSNTLATLKKLNVVLQVRENPLKVTVDEFCKPPSNMVIGETQRILTAIGEGWVELLGPSPPTPPNTTSDLGADREDGGPSRPSVQVGPVPPGEELQNRKAAKSKVSKPKATKPTAKKTAASHQNTSQSGEADNAKKSTKKTTAGGSKQKLPRKKRREPISSSSEEDVETSMEEPSEHTPTEESSDEEECDGNMLEEADVVLEKSRQSRVVSTRIGSSRNLGQKQKQSSNVRKGNPFLNQNKRPSIQKRKRRAHISVGDSDGSDGIAEGDNSQVQGDRVIQKGKGGPFKNGRRPKKVQKVAISNDEGS
ncbi:hypothetical protein PGT21_021861 [Puccinia graminis f. sp. tritici]|uniref:Uncharacterized protein n=1 Tax=Puccinia graminis f. sp. tritici TaxID=56615 RepID=A0A5B0LZM1_PUCGR|nr:hypothetical protein PGT21_021861 [Puccinia graminis f. sp. tritici]